MSFLLDLWTVLAVSAGVFFLAGTVDLLRFPDTLTRLHALTKADNLGLGLVVLGLLPHVGSVLGALKLITVWLFVLLAGANASPVDRPLRQALRAAGMTIALVLDASLVLLIVGIATWTVLVRDAFPAIAGFAVYGLLLALAWVRLAAVDAALTEAAIGGGLTGVLLIRAAVRLRSTEAAARAESPGPLFRLFAALLAAGFRGAAGHRHPRPARSGADAGARGCRKHGRDRSRQCRDRGVARLPRH